MLEKIDGIVLGVTRHSDRHNIIALYTRTRGRVSFLSPVGNGRQAAARYARLLPLSVVEADVNFMRNRELQKLGAVFPSSIWTNLYHDPAKRAVTLFISEFLNRLLRDTNPDPDLWDFIHDSVTLLDATRDSIANFHLAMLISLMPFTGIYPDTSGYDAGDFFDMKNACFVAVRPLHSEFLEGQEAAAVMDFCRMNFRNAQRFRLESTDRMRALRMILKYYAVHFPGVDELKSIEVLHEIFSFRGGLKTKNR